MKDLIYRQDAIDEVEKKSQVDGAYGYMDTKSIVDLLSDLPSAEQWTPVSEGLPEKNGLYLVTYVSGKANIDFSFFRMKKWHGLVNGEWTDYWYPVTAWMPLPEPYRGDADA